MTDTPLRLAVIVGSVREGRIGPTVATWFAEQGRRSGQFEVDVIDVATVSLPLTMPSGNPEADPEVSHEKEQLSRRLSAADAFAVVTPEYNHSYPAALKNAIDWFREEWQAKPVGLVSYGGQGGGIRAAEHLRQVFAELHTVTVRDALSFHNVWSAFGEDGQPTDGEAAAAAAKRMLAQLEWWATALRQARTQRPYAA